MYRFWDLGLKGFNGLAEFRVADVFGEWRMNNTRNWKVKMEWGATFFENSNVQLHTGPLDWHVSSYFCFSGPCMCVSREAGAGVEGEWRTLTLWFRGLLVISPCVTTVEDRVFSPSPS